MTYLKKLQIFEKFPQIFQEIVHKFNIIQYYSILSLVTTQKGGPPPAPAGAGARPARARPAELRRLGGAPRARPRSWVDSGSAGDRSNQSNFWWSEFRQISVRIQRNFLRILQEILKFEEFSILSRVFCEIPRKFDKNRCKNQWKLEKNSCFCRKFSKIRKSLLKFCFWPNPCVEAGC